MPYESEDGMSLTQILNLVLPRYGLAAETSCTCAVCESRRATRLALALHDRFSPRAARLG